MVKKSPVTQGTYSIVWVQSLVRRFHVPGGQLSPRATTTARETTSMGSPHTETKGRPHTSQRKPSHNNKDSAAKINKAQISKEIRKYLEENIKILGIKFQHIIPCKQK